MSACTCIDTMHDHEPGSCERFSAAYKGSVCHECHSWVRLDPGSDAAVAAGCRCPVMDNARGRGYLGQPGVFVMMADCPLHGGGK